MLNAGCWQDCWQACCKLQPACLTLHTVHLPTASCPLAPHRPRRAERDAATARLSAVVPELAALEATWARLHGLCGAASAQDVVAHWQGGWQGLGGWQWGPRGAGCRTAT